MSILATMTMICISVTSTPPPFFLFQLHTVMLIGYSRSQTAVGNTFVKQEAETTFASLSPVQQHLCQQHATLGYS